MLPETGRCSSRMEPSSKRQSKFKHGQFYNLSLYVQSVIAKISSLNFLGAIFWSINVINFYFKYLIQSSVGDSVNIKSI